ncbi:hypothetical protein DXG01_014572 [Tephrocybe rancida]|nr:hypothetical protein DXG01_014572 [Tephrocybe rancida]
MSRLTSAQVIALGEYLEPTFDPASLTVSQLLGVLGYHNIRYPTPYSKPKLAVIFNEEIKAKAANLKKERVKKENSIASDDGIVDGATGQPLRKENVTRRASRRLSHVPLEDEIKEAPAPRPLQPKRRRSSAQPTLGGPSRKTTYAQPALIEESEAEDEDLPVKKVGRSRKTVRFPYMRKQLALTDDAFLIRTSQAADDSGWEDNNIFQSGAESSSPARPSPVRQKTTRKGAPGPHKSRKSSSAPPQMLLSSPPRLPHSPDDKRFSPLSPPQSTFEPYLPSIPPVDQLRLSQAHFSSFTPSKLRTPVSKPQLEESGDELDIIGADSPNHKRPEYLEEVGSESQALLEEKSSDDEAEVDFVESEFNEDDLAPEEHYTVGLKGRKSFWVVVALLLVAGGTFMYSDRQESASIGYCNAGSLTNDVLDRLRTERLFAETCNSTSSAAGEPAKSCPSLRFIPWGPPDSCTPCPDHAKCTGTSAICDRGFLLRSHPLLFFLPPSPSPRNTAVSLSSPPVDVFWKFIRLLDGLPGFGSIALPPRCVEDPKRKRNIGSLGKTVENIVGKERGDRICANGKALKEIVEEVDGGEAKRWGLELEHLRQISKTARPDIRNFDETFNEAIQQLTQWGGIVIGEDRENYRYVAHTIPTFSWNCVIVIKSREIWAEWWTTVCGALVVILSLLYGRVRNSQKRVENKRVANLVQIALNTLRHQELAHHTDPVTVPQPYLSSLQLRDSILQDEHSVASRRRLWDQVERVVEGNANVRANLQEIQGGDEMRVWRWVGSAAGRRVVVLEAEPTSGDT